MRDVTVEERLQSTPRDVLTGLRRGIEQETLRVRPDGALATTPHPARLSSALTHPHITTDFSESQLELITGVHTSAEACVEELTQIHQFVYRALITEADVQHSMVRELTERVFAGDVTALVSHLLSARDMTPGDLARVKKLIRALAAL